MRRQLFLMSFAFAAAFGCGSLANPNDNSLAKIQGQLSGSGTTGSSAVPPNAHVAVVWGSPNGGALAVTNDAPVVDGAFTIDLSAPPPDSAFFTPSADSSEYWGTSGSGSSGSVDVPPSGTSTPQPAGTATAGSSTSGSNSSSATNVHLRDATGTVTNVSMSAAIAGFVVYVDANGNGKLDINADSSSSSPDTIIGGSSTIVLTYLRNANAIDLKDLSDRDGDQPTGGYNLADENAGWLQLSDVFLKLGTDNLPSPVCNTNGYATNGDATTVSAGTDFGSGGSSSGSSGVGGTSSDDAGAADGYPSPTDPNLTCNADGSWSYNDCPASTTPPPPAPGLCETDVAISEPACFGYGEPAPTGTVPSGWPCPVPASDGGAADAGSK